MTWWLLGGRRIGSRHGWRTMRRGRRSSRSGITTGRCGRLGWWTWTVELHPKVVSLAERSATVNDCVDVSRFLRHDAKTLEPRETPDPRPDAGVATLTLSGGVWKVTSTVQKGKCQ